MNGREGVVVRDLSASLFAVADQFESGVEGFFGEADVCLRLQGSIAEEFQTVAGREVTGG